ncbi:YesL family protein [Clostridium thermarum]|uniref:YesL family protein n=1 Tax=Clostridium thermarum TaxID=1716543 RepID=UPI0013D8626B|nr:DUF624 domain-containing protein [Clostridium thermarum]
MAKRNFFESPLYTITNYIYWFSITNIYFILTNLLLLLFLLTPIDPAEVNASYFVLFFIAALPVGPSLTALFSVMGKLVREKDLNTVTKDFFRAYKQNFKQSFLIWFLGTLMIAIMLVDIQFFSTKENGVIPIAIFNGLIIIMIILSLYVFPIVSRFYLKTSDVIKLSFYYAVKKFKITVMNIAAIVVVIFLIKKFPSVSFFFFASVASYIIMYYEKDIMKEIEDRITSASGQEKEDEDSNSMNDDIDEDIEAKEIENNL